MSFVTILLPTAEPVGEGAGPDGPAAGVTLGAGGAEGAAVVAPVWSALGAATATATDRVFVRWSAARRCDDVARGEPLAVGSGLGLDDGGGVPSCRATANPSSGGKGRVVISGVR